MRRIVCLALLMMASSEASATVLAESDYGRTWMASRDWRGVRRRESGGVRVTLRADDEIGIALDYHESLVRREQHGLAIRAVTREVASGARWQIGDERVSFVLGAGVSALTTEYAATFGDHNPWRTHGAGVGVWGSAGVRVRAGRVVGGADVRHVAGSTRTMERVRVSGAGTHVGVSVGIEIGRKP